MNRKLLLLSLLLLVVPKPCFGAFTNNNRIYQNYSLRECLYALGLVGGVVGGIVLVSFLYNHYYGSHKKRIPNEEDRDLYINRLILNKNYDQLKNEIEKIRNINALYFIDKLDPENKQEVEIMHIVIGDSIDYWLFKAIQEDSEVCVEKLLRLGANIETRSSLVSPGNTALMYALEDRCNNVVPVLLRHGANVFAVSLKVRRKRYGMAAFAADKELAEYIEIAAGKALGKLLAPAFLLQERAIEKGLTYTSLPRLPIELVQRIAYMAVDGCSNDTVE